MGGNIGLGRFVFRCVIQAERGLICSWLTIRPWGGVKSPRTFVGE